MAESRNTPKKATTSKTPAAKKTAVKKVAVKKVAAKKTVAKKPAAASAPAKRASVKKVAPKKQAPRAKKVANDDDDMASLMAMLNKSGKSNNTSRPQNKSTRASSTSTSNSRSASRNSSSTPAFKLPFMNEETDKVSYGLTVLAVLMCVATLFTLFVFNGGESRADACVSSKNGVKSLIAEYGSKPDPSALEKAATLNAKASANCTNDDYQLFYTNEWSAWMQGVTTSNGTTPVNTTPSEVAPTTSMDMGAPAPEGSSQDESQG